MPIRNDVVLNAEPTAKTEVFWAERKRLAAVAEHAAEVAAARIEVERDLAAAKLDAAPSVLIAARQHAAAMRALATDSAEEPQDEFAQAKAHEVRLKQIEDRHRRLQEVHAAIRNTQDLIAHGPLDESAKAAWPLEKAALSERLVELKRRLAELESAP
jgi:protein subunit release factor A